jgi:peptidoglycan/LPS O-acetylase OafA/YrhL
MVIALDSCVAAGARATRIPEREIGMLSEPRCPRYLSLDAWRGAACLLVILFHSTYYAPGRTDQELSGDVWGSVARACGWGWVGVPLFFVISGYCISATCDAERRRPRGTGDFFRRRLRRIFPPFWIFLAGATAVVYATEHWWWPGLFADGHHSIPDPSKAGAWTWAGVATLTETWRGNVIGPPGGLLMGHEWTLCYEEQFYLVCGLLLLISPRRFFIGVLVVTAATGAIRLVSRRYGWDINGFFFDGRWLLFALGILVYYHANYADRWAASLVWFVLVAGLVGSLLNPANVLRANATEYVSGFLFAIVLVALRPFDARAARSAFVRPLSWCGVMCYSLYLVHWPVCKALSHSLQVAGARTDRSTLLIVVPACLVASILVGWGFHVMVERRFLNKRLKVNQEAASPLSRGPLPGERMSL